MKEKPQIDSYLVPPRVPKEYADYSKYNDQVTRFNNNNNSNNNNNCSDPVRLNFETSMVLRQRLAYSYSEYVTHTVLHRISTIQWLPKLHTDERASYHQFIFGTNDNDAEEYYYEKNYLYVFGFVAPNEEFNGKIDKCRVHKLEMKGFAPFGTPTILKKIFVRDPIQLVRYMPVKSNMVATIGYDSNLMNIFDLQKHPKLPRNIKSKPKPNILLSTNSVFTHFDWNSMRYGSIMAGCQDGTLNVWDINSKKIQTDKETKPIQTFKAFEESEVVNCFWHPFSNDVVAAFSADGDLSLFDLRNSTETAPNPAVHTFKPHPKSLTTMSFSPLHEHLFATGASDSDVKLWDIRHMKRDIHTFPLTDPVTQVNFSPHCGHMLAAATTDPTIIILNCNKMGRLPPADRHIEDGHAEIQFIHFQHRPICDFNWGPPDHPWRFASVDNSLGFNLWMPSLKSVYEHI